MFSARRTIPGLLVTAIALALLTSAIHPRLLAGATIQESKSKTTRSKTASKPKDEDDSERLTGRLPAFYGQIGLNDEQRQEIYELQADYQPQIDELVAQLAELKAELDEKTEDILTTTQKRKLTSLRDSVRSGSSKGDSDAESTPKATRSTSRKKAAASEETTEDDE